MVKPNVRFIKLLLQNIEPSKSDCWNWRWRRGARRRHCGQYVSYQNFLIGLSMYFHLINVINTKKLLKLKMTCIFDSFGFILSKPFFEDFQSLLFFHIDMMSSLEISIYWLNPSSFGFYKYIINEDQSTMEACFVIKFSHSGGTWVQPFVLWYCHLQAKEKAKVLYMKKKCDVNWWRFPMLVCVIFSVWRSRLSPNLHK